jgi:hypothetical protein
MKLKTILDSIRDDLIKEGLDCFLMSDQAQDKLIIYAGIDKEERVQLLQISMQARKFPSKSKRTIKENIVLQFDSVFPFAVEDKALTEVAQFLHYLNFQIEIPGFYLNHLDNTIVYRYVLLSEGQHVPKKIIFSLIGIVMFFQDAFGQTLERLAKGNTTFVGVMEEIAAMLKPNLPPKS